jgi:hypothetical protein
VPSPGFRDGRSTPFRSCSWTLARPCDDFQDAIFRNLNCKTLQADEIWSYVYGRERNVPAEKRGEFGVGDVWTFVAIDADTRLVPAYINFARRHKSLANPYPRTPAMAAGLADRVWSLEDIAALGWVGGIVGQSQGRCAARTLTITFGRPTLWVVSRRTKSSWKGCYIPCLVGFEHLRTMEP